MGRRCICKALGGKAWARPRCVGLWLRSTPRVPFEPIGFWIHTDWAQIRKDLEERLDDEKIEVSFSDGGSGIEENLLRPGMDHQRPLVEKLHSIPPMHLTKTQLERLRPEDRPRIEALASQTQQGFEQLLEAMDPQRYPTVRTYIENLIHPVTTFFRWWLHKAELIPLNTNAIESAFSQVGNRIKRVGRRGSD